MDKSELNSKTIHNELIWLNEVIDHAFLSYFSDSEHDNYSIPDPPIVDFDDSIYSQKITEYKMSKLERLVIIICLAQHIRPNILDPFKIINKDYNLPYTEFGGIRRGDNFSPTGQTLSFLYGLLDVKKTIDLNKLFTRNHFFFENQILYLENPKSSHLPKLSGEIILNQEFIDVITVGLESIPNYSKNFPASIVETKMNFDDLIVDSQLINKINHMLSWIQNKDEILKQANSKKMQKGYKALFYGPSGTGKTMTAALIGKISSKKVFRVDLSLISSKWVGETEKTLSKLFDKADNKDWILFFDEADSIFGKRSNVNSSNEMYANQTVSYLLQRVEDFSGMIILASNFKGNIDSAFTRRFQTIVSFSMPRTDLQVKLWESIFEDIEMENSIKFKDLVKKYSFSGGSINNILKYSTISMYRHKTKILTNKIIEDAISNELRKEGKY